jgi:hypothetical protein
VKRESEKWQNKHSVAIAGIDLCHIYIYIFVATDNMNIEQSME